MACMEHYCIECDTDWFDNRVVSPCPDCGIPNRGLFDELPDYGTDEEEEDCDGR